MLVFKCASTLGVSASAGDSGFPAASARPVIAQEPRNPTRLEEIGESDMHAALVEDFSAPPRYREIPPPVPNQGELLLKVRAAALSNLVRGQASGSHYSSGTTLPFTPGNDGVGVAADGARFYFISPRAPFGSMAEYTVVSPSRTIPLAANMDDAVAAALGNPGLATWGSLLGRAKLQPGEGVMINGATGIAGKQAIQVAKYLGAAKIIATGRDPEALAGLELWVRTRPSH